MAASNEPNALLRTAEAHFAAGRAAAARPVLESVLRMVPGHPQLLRFHAIVTRALGDLPAARRSIVAAQAAAPDDAPIADTLGNVLSDCGEAEAALAAYARALILDPQFVDAGLHRAATLQELGRAEAARAAYRAVAQMPGGAIPALPAWAGLEIEQGELDRAAELLDRTLATEPDDPRAVRGRARVALERAEPDARARLAQARRTLPDNPALLLDALDAIGDAATIGAVEAAVAADPGWREGRRKLATFRHEIQRRDDWLALYDTALAVASGDPALWQDLIGLHASVDDMAGAADAAERAAIATGAAAFRAAAFGFHTGAGDLVAAARLLADPSTAARIDPLARAKYQLRRGDPAAAEAVLAQSCRAPGRNLEAWALRGVAWQALGDPRWDWLNGQPGLVQTFDLGLTPAEREAVIALLRRLHGEAALRIGQSVRGGTQTQGNLFARIDPELRTLRAAIFAAAERYRQALPPADPDHPVLRHRDAAWRMTASWSVRLTSGGFHVSHIHPKGVISSASYWVVPSGEQGEGQLELGRPPAYLGLDLPPIATIDPEPGRLALFPSTLHHGTGHFRDGERITAAFDLAP